MTNHQKHLWFGKNSIFCKIVSFLGHPEWCYVLPPDPIPPDPPVPPIPPIDPPIDPPIEPPVEPLPPKYEEYHINWIGLLSWMYNYPDRDIDCLLKETRKTGCSCVHSFAWVGDPSPDNAYTMYATPWEWRDDKIDFNVWNPKFWSQYRRLAQGCKDNDMDFMPILFMSRYNEHIFRNEWNHNGVSDFYSPTAMYYQKQYSKMCLDVLKEVYGSSYRPTVLLINEPAHYGDDPAGHQIAEWHRDLGDFVLQYTDPERMWIDTSHSEYAKAYFVEKHKCPKCEFVFGRDEYSHRPVRCESHGCSTKEGFIKNGYEHWTNSGWAHGAFSEDGSDSGSKLCDGIPDFIQADYPELVEALTWAETIKGNRQMYFVAFPFDPIKNAREGYSDPESFDWERLNIYGDIHE